VQSLNRNGEPFIIAAIPAYNEERTIARTILMAQKHVDKVVVCDDGSTDMTAHIARQLGADVAAHTTKKGYGAAIQTLFRTAKALDADIMVTLDADGQHNPGEIPAMVAPILESKADVVIGSRFLGEMEKRSQMPRYRQIGIKAITKLTRATSKHDLSDAQSGFRVYSRKALEDLSLCENGMGVSVEVLMEAKKHGLTVVEVPAECSYSESERTSTSNPLRHGVGVMMSIVKLVVEERPLVFLGIPGATCLMIGALFGIYMLQLYSIEHRIVTNVALASVAFALIGLFALFTAITLYAITRLVQKTGSQ
jgi:glycosyltransferase involved in cell wall biosynthesis